MLQGGRPEKEEAAEEGLENQVENVIKKIGLKEDALSRSKWPKGVKMVMLGVG